MTRGSVYDTFVRSRLPREGSTTTRIRDGKIVTRYWTLNHGGIPDALGVIFFLMAIFGPFIFDWSLKVQVSLLAAAILMKWFHEPDPVDEREVRVDA